MSVPTYNPKIQVTLKKTVRARAGVEDRFQGAAAEIDLSPFLGEGSSVTTQRGINQPAGGFSIRVGDRLLPGARQVAGAVDSLYALVEPMDVIEIRMRRGPANGLMPLVMRGLVSEVTTDEAMSEDGKPTRTVSITGQDWGKWLQIIQIKYIRGQDVADTIAQMTSAFLQVRYGIPYITLSAARFVEELMSRVVNKYIFNVYGDENAGLPAFKVDTKGADPLDTVFPIGLQANLQGTIWTYLQEHGNLGPFYELFIDDEEDGPTLVYRKPAYYGLQSPTPVFPTVDDADIEVYNISAADVVSLSASRSDADIANWFFVQSGRNALMQSIDQVLYALGGGNGSNLSLFDYPNSKQTLYGTRLMEVSTNHGYLKQGDKAEENEKSQHDLTTYLASQIEYIKESNRDNVVFERGSMVFKGDETIRPGRYFEVERRGLVTDGYITSVTQTFEPFRAFKTSVQFVRGNGWANRSKREASGRENPYRSLIGRGVY